MGQLGVASWEQPGWGGPLTTVAAAAGGFLFHIPVTATILSSGPFRVPTGSAGGREGGCSRGIFMGDINSSSGVWIGMGILIVPHSRLGL